MNTPTDTTNMTAVAAHPTTRKYSGIVNLSITLGLAAMCMMTAMRGAARMPFKTAAQNRARMGSMWRKFRATPARVATAIVT